MTFTKLNYQLNIFKVVGRHFYRCCLYRGLINVSSICKELLADVGVAIPIVMGKIFEAALVFMLGSTEKVFQEFFASIENIFTLGRTEPLAIVLWHFGIFLIYPNFPGFPGSCGNSYIPCYKLLHY